MNKKIFIFFAVGVYLFTTGLSFVFFSRQSTAQKSPTEVPVLTEKTGNDYEAIMFEESAPKTESCPLNGAMYSKEQKDWWEKHRPLGIMIENHVDARPQSGISFADVVYEVVAEGGITRMLSIYYCQDAGIVGPVRSARTYFLDFISEYGNYPLYAHVGGANTPGPADALGQIINYGWSQYNDLNQFSIGFPTFRRDESRLGRDVATEHTMYSNTTRLWEVAKKRKLTEVDKEGESWDESFVSYSFKEDADPAARPAAQTVHIDFWNNSDYAIDWIYDKKSNAYQRKNGGTPHMDRNTNKQVTAKNIVVLFMRESRAHDGYEGNLHLLYGTKGTGKTLIYMDGKEIKGTWKKAGRTGKTILSDSSGQEIKFNKGTIWFEIQPLDGEVIVK